MSDHGRDAAADSASPPRLAIHGLVRVLDGRRVLDGVDLRLAPGEVVAVLGPSGSGKTTLLRLIAGLDRPDAGVIDLDGLRASDDRRVLAPHRRGIGMVFQRDALWPHMCLRDNVAFAMPGLARRVARRRAEALLDAMGIAELATRYPEQVSGGEARRAALARALAGAPRLLLLDEPLSSLDVERKAELRALFRRAVERTWDDAVDARRARKAAARAHHERAPGAPAMLWVTHDPEEAAAMADRVLRLERGRLSS